MAGASPLRAFPPARVEVAGGCSTSAATHGRARSLRTFTAADLPAGCDPSATGGRSIGEGEPSLTTSTSIRRFFFARETVLSIDGCASSPGLFVALPFACCGVLTFAFSGAFCFTAVCVVVALLRV